MMKQETATGFNQVAAHLDVLTIVGEIKQEHFKALKRSNSGIHVELGQLTYKANYLHFGFNIDLILEKRFKLLNKKGWKTVIC